jgi:chaperone required for assembly of F1-ATPase
MKRFYKQIAVSGIADGFEILLDGRPIRTPAKSTLRLPTRALADAVAAEWAGQGETVDPLSMPHLRLSNTVIDGAAHREALAAAVLRFGENDLLCYRAHQPPELAELQREGWDPVLAWAAQHLRAQLKTAAGLTDIDQPPEAIAALRAAVAAFDSWALAGLHVIASITGSLLLALAVAEGRTSAAHAFKLSRIDEDYQARKWGVDSQAETRAGNLARELDMAAEFMALARVAPANTAI